MAKVRFTFNHLTYEVPEGIDIVVEVLDLEHMGMSVDFNFVKDGKIVPCLGGTDEGGRDLPTWEAIGIRQVPAALAAQEGGKE